MGFSFGVFWFRGSVSGLGFEACDLGFRVGGSGNGSRLCVFRGLRILNSVIFLTLE